MKKLFNYVMVLLVLFICFSCTSDSEKIIGIKIYEYNKDYRMLADKWKNIGINTAFVSKELAANTLFRHELKEKNIRVYIIFPVFYDPELLEHDSTLYAITNKGKIAKDDWVEFVCPSRKAFRNLKTDKAAELVKSLEPDGLSIDFIREFVFWEMIYPERTAKSIDIACFCDNCTGNFCKQKGITLPDTCITVVQKAAYILSFYSENWNDYRCSLIASMVKEIADKVRNIKPDIKINIHAVPWRDSDFGGANIRVAAQDIYRIAPFADYISPMCYSQMLKRDAGWIASVVREMNEKAPGMILPSIQVYPYYIDDLFTPDDFRECTDSALKDPSGGVVFFSWPLFEKDTVRIQIIRNRSAID